MSTYRIRQGDTLSALASRFHTSVSKLAHTNHIANPNLIYAGKSLTIPGHGRNDSFEPSKGGASHHGSAAHGGAAHGGASHASHGTKGSAGAGHSGGTKGSGHTEASHGTASPGSVTPAMRKLATTARSVAMGMGGYHSQGLCATGVSRTIQRALGISVHGNGNQIDNNLPRNKFKEVHMSLAQALKTPGLVLTWEKTSSRLGSIYGHTAITTGDGRSSISDFIERNTLASSGGRSGLKIFMPTV